MALFRKRRSISGRIILLVLLIIGANYFLSRSDSNLKIGPAVRDGLQGDWQAQTAGYEGYIADITNDILLLTENGQKLCSVEYHYEERTQLVTAAYRGDFGPFALFEYRSSSQSENGRPLLIGTIRAADGTLTEIYFKKIR